jgi:hyperosmotically inducible periplasmic protein
MKQLNVRLFLLGTVLSVLIGFASCKGGAKDSDIQASFSQKVQTDGRLQGVTASVNEGVVTLNGQCPDESCRSYAEQSAKEIKGVKSVVNNITMTPPATPDVSTDAALETGIKDATKDYPGVTATVSNGEVSLSGTIERDRLAKLMQAIHALNPKKVNNNLTVK